MTKFYLQYLFLFIGLGSYSSYVAVYLNHTLGFSGSQIGIITSIPAMIGILVLPLWGIISDITKKEKLILMFNFFISMILIAVFSTTKVFIVIVCIVTLLEMFRNALIPLLDNMAMSFCKEKSKNYGVIRSAGALGYGLGAFLTGLIIKYTNQENLFFHIYIASSFISFLIIPFLHKANIEENNSNKEKVNFKKDMLKISKNKLFLLLLLFSTLTLALTDGVGAYQGIYLVKLGAPTSEVGLLTVCTVLPEVFFLMKTKSYLDKFGHTKILICASLSLVIRFAIYTFTKNVFVFMIASSLHSLTIAFSMIAVFDLVKNVVPPNLSATSMTILNAVIGITCAFYKLIFGYFIDIMGIKSIFIIGAALSLIGLWVIKGISNQNTLNEKSYKTTNIKIS